MRRRIERLLAAAVLPAAMLAAGAARATPASGALPGASPAVMEAIAIPEAAPASGAIPGTVPPLPSFPAIAGALPGAATSPLPQQARTQTREQAMAWLTATLSQANQLLQAGRLAQAIRIAEQVRLAAEQGAAAAPALNREQLLVLLSARKLCADIYVRLDNNERALELYGAALALFGSHAVALPVRVQADILRRYDELCRKAGRPAQSVAALELAISRTGEALADQVLIRVTLLHLLGRAAREAGDASRARNVLLQGIAARIEAVDVMLPMRFPVARGVFQSGDLSAFNNAEQFGLEDMQAVGEALQTARADGRPLRDYAMQAGWERVDTAVSNLARLYLDQGQPAELESFYLGLFADYARRIQASPQPDGYAMLEMEYAALGAYLGACGRWQLANDAIHEALRLNARRLQAYARRKPADQLGATFATRRNLIDLLVSHHLAAGSVAGYGADGDGWHDVLGERLQGKALVSSAQRSNSAALRRKRTPEAARLLAEMARLDPTASPAAYVQQRDLAVALQREVEDGVAPLAFESGTQFLARVRLALGAEQLVSVSVFQPLDLATLRRQSARYLGQLVSADGVQARDLGPVAALAPALDAWRDELAMPPLRDSGPPRASAPLYQALLAPLLGPRVAAGRYVVDLDGQLAQLPLEALIDGSGQYLVERAQWRYISSARQLVEPEPMPARANLAVVMGAPDFGASRTAAASPVSGTPLRAALQALHFPPLPGAAAEMALVAATLRSHGVSVELRSGAQASAAYLRQLHGPRFLHLATHGFYLGDDAATSTENQGRDGNPYRHDLHVRHFDGGLALSGANTGEASVLNEGLLFSSGLGMLDLDGTELVVLSACDSGAGAAATGEAVDSLRQALEIAGARSAVTALWTVSDAGAAELMGSFYARLASGADKGLALQQAKLAMRQRWPHPFYWSSFVLSGMN